MYTTHQIKVDLMGVEEPKRRKAAVEVMLTIGELMPWLAAREFRGMTLTDKGDGYLLIVRAWKKHVGEVCFTGGQSPEDVFVNFAYGLATDTLKWGVDRYDAVRNGKK